MAWSLADVPVPGWVRQLPSMGVRANDLSAPDWRSACSVICPSFSRSLVGGEGDLNVAVVAHAAGTAQWTKGTLFAALHLTAADAAFDAGSAGMDSKATAQKLAGCVELAAPLDAWGVPRDQSERAQWLYEWARKERRDRRVFPGVRAWGRSVKDTALSPQEAADLSALQAWWLEPVVDVGASSGERNASAAAAGGAHQVLTLYV